MVLSEATRNKSLEWVKIVCMRKEYYIRWKRYVLVASINYTSHLILGSAKSPSILLLVSLGRTTDVHARFSKRQNFAKPNDRRAIDLMNAAAIEVVKQFTDIVVAYGQSDEYSFVLHEDCQLFERRAAKLATSISTAFSVEYCMQWDKYFPGQTLERPFPTFDGRCVLYPKQKILRDYLSWRQADCKSYLLLNLDFHWPRWQVMSTTSTTLRFGTWSRATRIQIHQLWVPQKPSWRSR